MASRGSASASSSLISGCSDAVCNLDVQPSPVPAGGRVSWSDATEHSRFSALSLRLVATANGGEGFCCDQDQLHEAPVSGSGRAEASAKGPRRPHRRSLLQYLRAESNYR